MSSQKKIEANRQNALASTGPKTARGKALSKLNALKSGAHAKTRVLPFEDPKVYDEIAHEVYEEIQPDGLLEEMLTDQIIHDFVVLNRLGRAENAYLVGQATFFAQERVANAEILTMDYLALEPQQYEIDRIMYQARGTKLKREDVESALANSVSKEEGQVYERIDRRRMTLMRSTMQKYREIDELRERRLKLIESVNDNRPK